MSSPWFPSHLVALGAHGAPNRDQNADEVVSKGEGTKRPSCRLRRLRAMEPIDVYDQAFLADPYPTYARLRDEDPVHRVGDGTWLLSRYEDVTRVVRDHDRFSSSPMNMGAPGFKFLIGAD